MSKKQEQVQIQENFLKDVAVGVNSLCSLSLLTNLGISCCSLKVEDQQRQDHFFLEHAG